MNIGKLLNFENIDRRILYLLLALSLALPLVSDWIVKPAHMHSADAYYAAVDTLTPSRDKIVLVAVDWGPSTQAENAPQTEVTLEHLMRKGIPFALISNIPYAEPFMNNMPKDIAARLKTETGKDYVYGRDWVNLGYQPGGVIIIQSLAKAKDLGELLKADSKGTPLKLVPMMKHIKTIENISLLVEVTGSVGMFESWVQFFQTDNYHPPMVHACTSITIPSAHSYLAAGQIVGLFEGVAGAAAYEDLLTAHYPVRKVGSALRMNTSLAVAQLLIIVFIILGNLGAVLRTFNPEDKA